MINFLLCILINRQISEFLNAYPSFFPTTDITFNFLYIPIFSYNVDGNPYPSEPAGIINPENLSYINAGHNLAMTNVNKRYYPVVSEDPLPLPEPEFRKKPIYNSYPFELIFNALPYRMVDVPPPP